MSQNIMDDESDRRQKKKLKETEWEGIDEREGICVN